MGSFMICIPHQILFRSYSQEWDGQERRGACRDLVGKPEWNIPFRRPSHRWDNNIKRDLPRNRFGGGHRLDFTDSRQRQVAHRYECSGEPSGSVRWGIFCTSWGSISFSRRTLLHGLVRYMKLLETSFFSGPYDWLFSTSDPCSLLTYSVMGTLKCV